MNATDIYEAMKQGILICDAQARILYFNASYADFIGEKLVDVKGKNIRDIRPGAVVPEVIASGQPRQSLHRIEHGQEYFVDIYPVRKEGRVAGTVSIVMSLEDAKYFKDTLENIERERQTLQARLSLTNGTRYTFDSIIGDSEALLEAVQMAKRIAAHDTNVLLQGESGCGKELFAQAIHNAGGRKQEPFVAINCAAISKTMLESELFGYEDGAFTGAKKGGKPGLFETAGKGTLFLDEISEMDFELQAKLLRVLQEKKFRRIGGTKEQISEVRVISACNVDLLQYIEEKKFRRDLYYRIAAIPVHIPPLRSRGRDILLLAEHFLQEVRIQHKRKYVLTEEVIGVFQQYAWPGNIRELRNTIDYAAMMAVDENITAECLPPIIPRGQQQERTLAEKVREFEKKEIRKVIQQYGEDTASKKKAAAMLGISLSSLYAKLSE